MSDPIALLITDVSRLMRRRFDERARTIGATRAQWRALTALHRHEGIHQGGLAELLEVEPITLCRMIDRLVDAGLVERRRPPGDRRAWQIHLTAKARPMLDQLGGLARDLTARALIGLDPDAQARLTASLEQIRNNLHAPDALPDAINDEKEAGHG